MKILVFDADQSVREAFAAGLTGHEILYIDGSVSPEALKEHADAEVVSLFVASGFTKGHIAALPNLKCIAARSTGVDNIDMAAVKERGIIVCNVPSYGARTVAEFTFSLLLAISRRLPEAANQVRQEGNFETRALEGFDLFGRTIGVIGTGAIGKNVVKIASGFGMKVLMFDKFPAQGFETPDAKYVPLDELLAQSDIVTLHVPYFPENHHLLNREAIAKMKRGAYVINTARGELIDTAALLEALKSGAVAGAGLDVLEGERALKDEMELVMGTESINTLKAVIRDHMLIDMPRVIVTPHIAFFSREAYTEILSTSAKNIANFAAGTPSNIVKM
ncbi:MAG: NAD(P)-dependent oxidoreductase [Patescibacteria group bacterium]